MNNGRDEVPCVLLVLEYYFEGWVSIGSLVSRISVGQWHYAVTSELE